MAASWRALHAGCFGRFAESPLLVHGIASISMENAWNPPRRSRRSRAKPVCHSGPRARGSSGYSGKYGFHYSHVNSRPTGERLAGGVRSELIIRLQQFMATSATTRPANGDKASGDLTLSHRRARRGGFRANRKLTLTGK
ncbi:hypothetical protein [Paraburkholderia megapolitana]|uniref:hypothetical protein n=1 Tax=Paraburkholderia megapolitana TaxID=420953 RepID=UPI0038B80D2D